MMDRKFKKAMQFLGIISAVGWIAACTARSRANHFNDVAADAEAYPDRILQDLQISAGMKVADLGAGGGYYSYRFAAAVGAEGRVFAIDVNDDFLGIISNEADKRGLKNVITVKAENGDSGLKPDTVDLVFIRNVYHHLPQPRVDYFKRLAPALKKGGRVAIIDYKNEGFNMAGLFGHATDADEITKDMTAAGFETAGSHGYLPRSVFYCSS